jgi:glycosyltransferase involved in cell wall biosynthesis
MLTFSVVVCTHNRAHYLPDLIVSLRAQDFPAGDFEIIIVDNASIDGTAALVKQLQAESDPPIRYVYEPLLGANRARNTGAKAAKGEIVIYIDDDALAETDWLQCLARAYQEVPHDVVCVGGRVELLWENGNRPSWLACELEGYYSSTARLGQAARCLTDNEYPVGANMSIRRDSLLGLGGFHPLLDRVGENLLSNVEAGLCAEIRNAGLRVYFEPSACVWHRVPTGRTTKRWLLRRTFWQGISDAVVVWYSDRPTRTILFRRVAVNVVFALGRLGHAALHWLRRQESKALTELAYAVAYLGRIWKDLQFAVCE